MQYNDKYKIWNISIPISIQNLLTEISASICHHFTQLENLAAVVLACYRILLEQAGHAVICDQIVSNKLGSKVRKCDWVFDEDCEVFCSAHESAFVAQWKFVNFNWTPRLNLTSMGTRRCVRSEKYNLPKIFLKKYIFKSFLYCYFL